MPRDLHADQATLNAVLMHAQNRDWQRATAAHLADAQPLGGTSRLPHV